MKNTWMNRTFGDYGACKKAMEKLKSGGCTLSGFETPNALGAISDYFQYTAGEGFVDRFESTSSFRMAGEDGMKQSLLRTSRGAVSLTEDGWVCIGDLRHELHTKDIPTEERMERVYQMKGLLEPPEKEIPLRVNVIDSGAQLPGLK